MVVVCWLLLFVDCCVCFRWLLVVVVRCAVFDVCCLLLYAVCCLSCDVVWCWMFVTDCCCLVLVVVWCVLFVVLKCLFL